MKDKLTEDDYLLLYPLLSPSKIVKTFEGMTLSARGIQQLYKTKDLIPTDIARDEIFKRSFAIADINVSEHEWGNAVMSVMTKLLCERVKRIRERAKRYEELF